MFHIKATLTLVIIQTQIRELQHSKKMKKTNCFSILVFLFFFLTVFHEYEGAKTEKGSKTEIGEQAIQQIDHRRRLVHGDQQQKHKHNTLQETAKSGISRAKHASVQKNDGQKRKMRPINNNLKPNHVAGLQKLVQKRTKGASNDSLLCIIIALIKLLFGINIYSDVCDSSNNQASSTASNANTSQTTPSQQNNNTQQTASTKQTANQTTIKPSSEQTISFSDDFSVYLTCQHVPDSTIKIIDATFGSKDSSCPATSVASYMSQYTNGKTSLMLRVHGYYFGNKCGNVLGSTVLTGTYTCTPRNTPGGGNPSIVIDACHETQFSIRCPTGTTILLDSAMYGSMDGVTCSATSVMNSTAFQAAINSGLTSFSLFVSSETTFDKLCSGSINKLSVTYRCQTSSGGSTFKSVAQTLGSLNMACPQSVVGVSSVNIRSRSDSTSCFTDLTAGVRSLLPPQTTEVFFSNLFSSTACSNLVVSADYTCGGTVSQFTLVAQDLTHVTLQCPAGQKIHLVTSKYYCTTNPAEKVYNDPVGLVKKCEGKESVCYFFVATWKILDLPFDQNYLTAPHTASFPNCKNNAGDENVLLSVTYTCTV